MKIYALKPFEADIGTISPATESSMLSAVASVGLRGTSGDVTLSPTSDVIVEHDATSSNSATKL